ncbi:MAG: O-acetyl-ADP-ribose deacetylase [Candidatus Cloacimonetes bacterium]|nr:O-acetyl-ADP-ribose deacetylase [Candidatus Cloacimonadota bacterium]
MKTKIEIIKADITTLKVDAIVNAANNLLLGDGGVDGAIHKAAGSMLLTECRSLNGCATGEAKITKGYDLPAKFVIHTVGPIWQGGNNNEEQLLRSCYENCLRIAVQNKLRSIAFPAISTGVYRFPKELAAKIALETINKFIRDEDSLEKIILTCFSEKSYELYVEILTDSQIGI